MARHDPRLRCAGAPAWLGATARLRWLAKPQVSEHPPASNQHAEAVLTGCPEQNSNVKAHRSTSSPSAFSMGRRGHKRKTPPGAVRLLAGPSGAELGVHTVLRRLSSDRIARGGTCVNPAPADSRQDGGAGGGDQGSSPADAIAQAMRQPSVSSEPCVQEQRSPQRRGDRLGGGSGGRAGPRSSSTISRITALASASRRSCSARV
jgi:hypothetical protein